MPTTNEQWKVAQSWIGPKETQTTFNERFDRLGGSLDLAITESLRSQLSSLTSQPASVGLPDGTNVNTAENIRTLREQLKQFIAIGGTSDPTPLTGQAATAKVHRADQSR